MSAEELKASDSSNTQSKAKSKKKKKRKLSKPANDTLDYSITKQEDENQTAQSKNKGSEPLEPSPSKQRKKKKNHVKDPSDTASYLSTWKSHQDDSNVPWKFNKNTQSWLIRHMYDPGKVSKPMFATLLEYLKSSKSETVKNRSIEDARRRALRYKHYEKEAGESDDDSQAQDGKATDTPPQEKNEDLEEDEKRWKLLSDHEKRKEYKRARKVLDTLQ